MGPTNMKEKKSIKLEKHRYSVLEKGPVGSKVLERRVRVSNSEIKAEKGQPDREDRYFWFYASLSR